jgi:hypothetical protein
MKVGMDQREWINGNGKKEHSGIACWEGSHCIE